MRTVPITATTVRVDQQVLFHYTEVVWPKTRMEFQVMLRNKSQANIFDTDRQFFKRKDILEEELEDYVTVSIHTHNYVVHVSFGSQTSSSSSVLHAGTDGRLRSL